MINLDRTGIVPRLIYQIRLRARLRPLLRKIGWHLAGARFGADTSVSRMTMTWPHQVRIGRGCILEDDLYFKFDGHWQPGPSIIVGDDTCLGRGCEFNIRRGIRIGNHCLIASGCKFIDGSHGMAKLDVLMSRQEGQEIPIVIEDNVWLGANVIVLKGVTIGTGAVVGAGAVVTKSVSPNTIVAGVPARKIGDRAAESSIAYSPLRMTSESV